VIPLLIEERLLGTLGVYATVPGRTFTTEDLQLLELLGQKAGIALENARLFEQVHAGREQVRAVSRRLVEVQESKGRELARELHDEIGQLLTGLKLSLEMSRRVPAHKRKARLREADALVDDLLARVRELSLDLRPTMLDDLGLLPALLWHTERYTAQTRVRVTLRHAGVEGRRFPLELETAIYRIVQEALTNVARHAGVREVTVKLWADQDTLGMQVEDQGKGFEPEAAMAAYASTGLTGMRERATLLGGQLTVESAPGTGTRVTAELPLGERIERRTQERGA
jgi:signal transduction histidine kinase